MSENWGDRSLKFDRIYLICHLFNLCGTLRGGRNISCETSNLDTAIGE